jgi:sterol 14alpha-demethylase
MVFAGNINMPAVLFVATAFAAIVLFITFNVLRQIFLEDPTRPPEVFHWLPLIGSTIQYGKDPYAFFFKCRAKVCESA